MRAGIIILIVGAILFGLWYMGQGDTATVPDAPSTPDIPLPDNPEDVAEATDNFIKKVPPWGWQVVGVLIIVALLSSIKKRNPVLFWGVLFVAIGIVIGQAFIQ